MNKYIISISILLVCFSSKLIGQNAKITFRSDTEITVRVNKPIDGNYNPYVVSDRFDLKPGISVSYDLNIDDFEFVKCNYSDGGWVTLLITAGDEMEVTYKNSEKQITGDNAAGNMYYHQNYTIPGSGVKYPDILSFIKPYDGKELDFATINKNIENFTDSTYRRDIESLRTKGEISDKFAKNITKNIDYIYLTLLYAVYDNIVRNNVFEKKVSASEIKSIIDEYGRILDSPEVMNRSSTKYPFGTFFTDYHILKYRYMLKYEPERKFEDELLNGYDKDIFGDYISFLQAPDYMYPCLFGEKMIIQIQNMYDYFDQDKMLAYLKAKFPESEYIGIIEKMIDEEKKKKKASKDSKEKEIVILNRENITSLQGLVNTDQIKGNYVYIDLWATWCMPCIMEFQYHDDMQLLFSKYGDIVPVYLSIDEDGKDNVWQKSVDRFNLTGFNIRASKPLLEEISKKVYNGSSSISVPRYILLNPQGNILNDNLPRPSRMKQLEQALDEIIQK